VVFSWYPFTNKTDRHDITEILLKVALSIVTLTLTHSDSANTKHKGNNKITELRTYANLLYFYNTGEHSNIYYPKHMDGYSALMLSLRVMHYITPDIHTWSVQIVSHVTCRNTRCLLIKKLLNLTNTC
jgi:hypothetical protein